MVVEVNIEPICPENRTGPEPRLGKGEGEGKGDIDFFLRSILCNTCYCNDDGKHPIQPPTMSPEPRDRIGHKHSKFM